MVSESAVAFIVVLWAFCLITWWIVNWNLVHNPDPPEPFIMDAVLWWSQYALWTAVAITVIMIVIMVIADIVSVNASSERRRRIERARDVVDMDSTDLERELRRRLRDDRSLQ